MSLFYVSWNSMKFIENIFMVWYDINFLLNRNAGCFSNYFIVISSKGRWCPIQIITDSKRGVPLSRVKVSARICKLGFSPCFRMDLWVCSLPVLLTVFKHNNGYWTQLGLDEVFGFICQMTTEVPSYNIMPGGTCQTRFSYDLHHPCYVLLFQCPSSTLYLLLLYLLQHDWLFFYHCTSVAHTCPVWFTAVCSWEIC